LSDDGAWGNASEEYRLQQTKDKDKEKVRVFALARQLGVDSKTVIDLCKSLGFDVKSQLASLETDQVELLKQRIAKGIKPAAPEPVRPAAAAVPAKEKKILTLQGKTKAEPKSESAPTIKPEPQEIDEPAIAATVAAPAEISRPVESPETPVAPVAAKPTPPSPEPPRKIPDVAPPVVVAKAPTPAPELPQAPPVTAAAAPVAPTSKPPTRMPNLTGARPATLDRVRPQPSQPSAGGAPATKIPSVQSPAARSGIPPARTAAPPAPGAPAAPRPGGGVPAPGPAAPGQRHRRTESERKPQGGVPGARTPGGGDKDKKIAPTVRFTPEQLQALRDGRSVTEVLKKPAPGALPGQVPSKVGDESEELDEDGKKKTPGKVAGRDARHSDRAKRQEQRKVRQNSVVIQDGHVDLIEDERIRRRKSAKQLLKKRQPGTVERKGKIPIREPITVRSLSEDIGMKVGELLFKLKDLTNGLYNVNSPVETEVAELIATEKGVDFEIVKKQDIEAGVLGDHATIEGEESQLEPRAPVVTIMGHVDHGKTSLLDKIRKSNVVATEAGGITQVIRAWRVIHAGKPITFLDTPGHEAFTKMRARGANVTDIVVIVVAANDGVMPQTEEAINHAKAANVSIVVAINKVDLPDANLRRTEQQLYGLGLIPDTMGGDCQFVHTSATKGTGIDDLLETLTLVAELKELKANPHKAAMGTCLEAYMSGDEGVMATLLVQQGTLHKGDIIICGATYGRIRAMYDDMGQVIQEAGPSVPVRVTGLNEVPNADDHFHVVADVAKAREIAETRKERAHESLFKPREAMKLEDIGEKKVKIAELKVVLKAEARGSIEAIRKELEKLVHEEVRVRLLHAGIGAITESDVQLALASPQDTIIVGFNVVPDDQAMHLADERGISIREYNIIYKLTEDIKSALEGKLKPREEIIHLGRAIVREVFKISRVGTVAGCYVTQGVIERSAKVRLIREGAIVYPPPEKVASLDSLKRFKEDVREVREGYDCGMKIAGYDDIKKDDVIEAYRIEQVQRTL